MKKLLSIILAVVMIASLLPATFMTAAAAEEGDIVFDFNWFALNGKTQGTELKDSGFPGLTLNTSGTGANSGVYAQVGSATSSSLRWNNTKMTWQEASPVASIASSNNKAAFDYTVETAGWYRFKATGSSNSATTSVLAVYDIYNDAVPTFLGEVKLNEATTAVYLEKGTHTLVLCGVYTEWNGGADDCFFFSAFTFEKVDAPTGSVAVDGFPTTTLKVGTEVTDLTAVVNTNYGVHEFSGYSMRLASATKYRVHTSESDAYNYLKVTYDKPGVVEVTVTPNTDVGAKGSIPYSIKAVGEGTANVTFTPVIGGVPQTALETTETIKVTDDNIVFDFVAYMRALDVSVFDSTLLSDGTYRFKELTPGSTYLPENFDINTTGTAQTSGFFWERSVNGPTAFRASNVYVDWQTKARSGGNGSNNKFAIDITVPVEKEGWYVPSVVFYTTNAGSVLSVYHVYEGKATFIGDMNAATADIVRTANAVNLKKGKNTFVFAGVESSAEYPAFYMKKFALTKLAEAPTMSKPTVSEIPDVIAASEKVSGTVTVSMSDGSLWQFPEYAMASNFQSAGKDTNNYVKVTTSKAGIVEVTDAKPSGALKKTSLNFSVTGVTPGTTELIFTPVIDGEQKTEYEFRKQITVSENPDQIVIDKATLVAIQPESSWTEHPNYATNGIKILNSTYHSNPSVENIVWPSYWKILEETSANVQIRNTAGIGLETAAGDWVSAGNAHSSKIMFEFDVAESQKGPFELAISTATDVNYIFDVYHIVDGNANYIGKFDVKNQAAQDYNTLNLKVGKNVIALVRRSGTGANHLWMNSLTLTRVAAAQTVSSVETTVPSTIDYNAVAPLSATVAMSDGENYQFTANGMNASTGSYAGAEAVNKLDITSSNASVVKVMNVAPASDDNTKINYTLVAVGAGSANITITPYIGGVAQTPVVKNVQVTYPNDAITGNSVSIGLTAIANGAISPDAKALISADNGIVAGNVNSVEVGTKVTLTATEGAGYTFLYWYNGNSGKILSDEAEYTFVAGTNIPVYAKYLADGEELTEYASASGTLVSAGDIKEMPEKPYKKAGYTLYVDAVELANAEEASVTDTDAVYWTKEDQIVSYNTTYTYLKWGNLNAPVAVKEGEKSDVPAVVLFESNGAYMLELVNFDGIEIIEKGILFDGDISSCHEKAVAYTDTKQFTATGDGEARAYVIYKDGVAIRVAYSD